MAKILTAAIRNVEGDTNLGPNPENTQARVTSHTLVVPVEVD